MFISDFNYYQPSSVEEACRILSESPDGVPFAGGTDLLVEMKQGLRHHQDIVSLTAIEELKAIHQDSANFFFGAGVTHNEIIASPLISESFPAISEAASTIGTDQVRNTGTIGGNLCTGASCCDMAPILMAFNANVEICSSTKSRIVPLNKFFISHRETCIKKGEVMTRIIIPRAEVGTSACFEKFGLREAASISVASVAVAIIIKDNICVNARFVVGAAAPTPKFSTGASDILIGEKISEFTEDSSILKLAAKAAAADSLPIDDLRGSVNYRRHLVKILTKRAIVTAFSRGST